MKIGELKTKKVTLSIIAVATIIIGGCIIINIFPRNSNRGAVILDTEKREYYRIEQALKSKKSEEELDLESVESKMIIPDNGFADSVITQVLNDMIERLGYSEKDAIKALNNKELVIESTVDGKLQEIVDEVFLERSTFTDRKKGDYNQSAMVVMDYDGNVKAIASGNNSDKTKNRATDTLLQVGSTIKPISIYAPAIENDVINFSSIIEDIPTVTYNSGEAEEWPKNYDDKYEINITTTEALQKSKNTIPVRIGQMMGIDNSFNFLRDKVGYSTLVDSKTENNDRQLAALALGYFTKGITLDTLVASYEIFGNGGFYSEPKLYTSVKDVNGDVILENKVESEQVISEETATIMNRLLHNNINGEDTIIKNANIDGTEVLGKTGTVGGENDETISQLFVGMTPDYIAGVWSGYDEKEPMIYGTYNSPVKIWKKVMEDIDIINSEFKISDKVKKEEYCSVSGLLKTDNCIKSKIGYYKHSNILDVCNICK